MGVRPNNGSRAKPGSGSVGEEKRAMPFRFSQETGLKVNPHYYFTGPEFILFHSMAKIRRNIAVSTVSLLLFFPIILRSFPRPLPVEMGYVPAHIIIGEQALFAMPEEKTQHSEISGAGSCMH